MAMFLVRTMNLNQEKVVSSSPQAMHDDRHLFFWDGIVPFRFIELPAFISNRMGILNEDPSNGNV